MRVDFDVPKDKLVSAIISGVEGGIRYWAKVTRCELETLDVTVEEREPYAVGNGQVEYASFSINGGEYSWTKALQVMAAKYPRHLADLLSETQCDATTGDVLIQCACFGELKYG